MAKVLGALFQNESGGRNIPNVHEGTSSGQAQGYFQITTGTWNDFGGQQYAPTPLQATYAQQAAIAAKIPLKRWDETTVAKMRRASGGNIDPNRTLGENLAMNGEGFGTDPGGGGDQSWPMHSDPNWRPQRPGQGPSSSNVTTPLSPPGDPNWRPTRPGQEQSGVVTTPLSPPQIPYGPQFGPQMDPAQSYFPPAPDKPETWREKLAKMANGYKPPAVSMNDTALSGMAMPKAARVDQAEVPMFDPNALMQQRNELAIAMQKLNSGKLFL